MTKFWETVKGEIKDSDTTQEWLAAKIGVSFNTLRSWVSKDILPRADDAVRIARALGTTVEYLLTGEKERAAGIADSIDGHIRQIQKELAALGKTARKLR